MGTIRPDHRDPGRQLGGLPALSFAAAQHRDQRRKDPDRTSYINHPIGVFRVLAVEGGVREPVALCTALLHDTLETTAATERQVDRCFEPAVLRVVVERTDDQNLPKQERKRLQVEHAGRASREAHLVKRGDKICNLRDVAERPPVGWDLPRQQGIPNSCQFSVGSCQ